MRHGRQIKTEPIFKKLEKYEVITFDIFDTLIKRDIGSPTDVFCLVEKEYNRTHIPQISEFSRARQLAERKAREKSCYDEVTLDEIYNETDYPIELQAELKKIEVDIEIGICVPHQPIVDIYHQLLIMKKRLILISDMYLPKPAVEQILIKCHIEGYESIWLSSELRCRNVKGLFRKYLEGEGYKGKIIHIGDSLKSDRLAVWRSAKLNYHTLLIPRRTKNIAYLDKTKNRSLSANIINSFINNHLPIDKGYFYTIGYSLYGPLIYGFVDWIIANIRRDKVKKILFLARDSYVIQKAFHLVWDGSCSDSYFYLSRRSIFGTRLQGDYSLENVLDKVHMRVEASIESILKHMDAYTTENIQTAISMGIDLKDVLPEKDNNSIVWQYLKKINDKMQDVYRTKANLFEEYVSQFIGPNDRIAIVDVGWNGTAQKAIDIAQKNLNLDAHIHGYYLGINKMKNGREKDVEMEGFLVDEDTSEEGRIRMKAYMGFLEFFLSAPHGMTTGYVERDGEIIPKMEPYEYLCQDGSQKKEVRILNELQTGALDFIREIRKSGLVDFIEWNSDDVTAPLFSLCVSPRNIDLRNFGDIDFFDTDLVPMAKPQQLAHYFARPSDLKRDFAKSTWKPGFLKRMMKGMPLPYYSMYKFLLLMFHK